MPKNIVICCDGTGNEVEGNFSNVLKLFRICTKSAQQEVYYNPGVGTIASDDAWSRFKKKAWAVFGLATGYGLDDEIKGGYRFLCERWEPGDSIYLFGFSRGAYTVRALGGFLHMVGLLPANQVNLIDHALTAYKRSSAKNDFQIAWNFGRMTGSRHVTIDFVGVWDTVASVIVPRADRLLPTLQTLPYTAKNPSVKVFRHAMSIDERRRMFRLNRWNEPQAFVANPFDKDASKADQNIKQVWFAGVHSDVGGGYPESESGLSKYPLAWMIGEAETQGLLTNAPAKRQLVKGEKPAGSTQEYVGPDVRPIHDSLSFGWRVLEWIPKSAKWLEWRRKVFLGMYLPKGEPRDLTKGLVRVVIHTSAKNCYEANNDKFPENWIGVGDTEPPPGQDEEGSR
jgi:uncharacterized protein (DUF2235 family)